MRSVSPVLDQLRALGDRAGVLATVVDAAGTGSVRAGTTMVVDADGNFIGGLTIGGCVDARVREAAADVLATGSAVVLDVPLGDDDAVAMGLACGGEVRVRLEPTAGLVARYETTASDTERTTVMIVGAGEVASALVPMLRPLGVRSLLVEGRDTHRAPAEAAGADVLTGEMAVEVLERELAARAEPPALVVLAHDYRVEVPLLERALAAGVPYVGMLASRKRAAAVMELLAERGVSADAVARIRAPIGLDIGARTPAEIAVSIAAELVAVQRAGRDSR